MASFRVSFFVLVAVTSVCHARRLKPVDLTSLWTDGTDQEPRAASAVETGGSGDEWAGWPVGPATTLGFKGGCWTGHSALAGFVAGMASAANSSISQVFTPQGVSCNSGSCWILGHLFWSKNLQRMLQDMAIHPERAHEVYQARFVNQMGRVYDEELRRKRSSSMTLAHALDTVSCCRRKSWLPCRSTTPNKIITAGHAFCCPAEVTKGCRSKGLFPCARVRQHKLKFGDSTYCCPTADSADAFNAKEACNFAPVKERAGVGLDNLIKVALNFASRTETDYADLIMKIMENSGDVDMSLPLSTPPVSWAKGKDLAFTTSILVGPKNVSKGVLLKVETGALFRRARYVVSTLTDKSQDVLKNWSCSGFLCGAHVPAVYSVRMGERMSPMPVTSGASALVFGQEYKVLERRWFTPFKVVMNATTFYDSGEHDHHGWNGSYEVPINKAVAASSAALGCMNNWGPAPIPWMIYKVLPSWLQSRFLATSVMMSASAPRLNNMNFQATMARALDRKRSSEQTLAEIAKDHVIHLGDGATTDSTGMGHWIAAGHDRIAVVWNCANVTDYNDMTYFFMHFAHSKALEKGYAGYVAGYQLFREDLDEYIRQAKSFLSVDAVAGSRKLKRIVAGTLHLTTVDCPAFGVAGGRKITIHLTLLEHDVQFCDSTFETYSNFAGEIVRTLKGSRALATRIWDMLSPNHTMT